MVIEKGKPKGDSKGNYGKGEYGGQGDYDGGKDKGVNAFDAYYPPPAACQDGLPAAAELGLVVGPVRFCRAPVRSAIAASQRRRARHPMSTSWERNSGTSGGLDLRSVKRRVRFEENAQETIRRNVSRRLSP